MFEIYWLKSSIFDVKVIENGKKNVFFVPKFVILLLYSTDDGIMWRHNIIKASCFLSCWLNGSNETELFSKTFFLQKGSSKCSRFWKSISIIFFETLMKHSQLAKQCELSIYMWSTAPHFVWQIDRVCERRRRGGFQSNERRDTYVH